MFIRSLENFDYYYSAHTNMREKQSLKSVLENHKNDNIIFYNFR